MPITDQFDFHHIGLSSPLCGGFDITSDDAADLPQVTRALMAGSAGDIAVLLKNGETLVLPGLAAGVVYPFRVVRVLSTGTTATGLKGLY
jgi:hypothetical protein